CFELAPTLRYLGADSCLDLAFQGLQLGNRHSLEGHNGFISVQRVTIPNWVEYYPTLRRIKRPCTSGDIAENALFKRKTHPCNCTQLEHRIQDSRQKRPSRIH